MKIAIVASQFNKVITDNLIMGAKQKFTENSFSVEDINIYIVPGAFEIPSFIKNLIDKNEKYDAIIAFGSVIKGETAHFEYISNALSPELVLSM